MVVAKSIIGRSKIYTGRAEAKSKNKKLAPRYPKEKTSELLGHIPYVSSWSQQSHATQGQNARTQIVVYGLPS